MFILSQTLLSSKLQESSGPNVPQSVEHSFECLEASRNNPGNDLGQSLHFVNLYKVALLNVPILRGTFISMVLYFMERPFQCSEASKNNLGNNIR